MNRLVGYYQYEAHRYDGRRTHLSETHLVGENTVDTLLVQSSQPVETLQLVLLERGHEHLRLCDGEFASEGRRVLEVELVRIDLRNVRLHLERP